MVAAKPGLPSACSQSAPQLSLLLTDTHLYTSFFRGALNKVTSVHGIKMLMEGGGLQKLLQRELRIITMPICIIDPRTTPCMSSAHHGAKITEGPKSPDSGTPRNPQCNGEGYSQAAAGAQGRHQEGTLLNPVCWLPPVLAQATCHPAFHAINSTRTNHCRPPLGCSEGTPRLHLKTRVPKPCLLPQVAESVSK